MRAHWIQWRLGSDNTVGKATKLSQYLMSLDKAYQGTITLGETTNTYDKEGEMTTFAGP